MGPISAIEGVGVPPGGVFRRNFVENAAMQRRFWGAVGLCLTEIVGYVALFGWVNMYRERGAAVSLRGCPMGGVCEMGFRVIRRE